MLIEQMASHLGVRPSYIVTFARGASHAYKTYEIEKRNGDKRRIDHPSKQLKSMQRWILEYLLPSFPVHSAAAAYRKGKTIFDNASIHVTSKYLLRMDFANFFPSLCSDDFRSYRAGNPTLFTGCTGDDFEVLCLLVFKNSRLTVGAPTSPAISNTLCFDMDTAIAAVCHKRSVKYSRYADDLFFSTIEADILHSLQSEIESLISALTLPAHLSINPAKTRHSSRRGARRVTGIVIGSDRKPHIGRSLKRTISIF